MHPQKTSYRKTWSWQSLTAEPWEVGGIVKDSKASPTAPLEASAKFVSWILMFTLVACISQAWRSGWSVLCKSCKGREITTGSWVFKEFSGEVGDFLGSKGIC